MSKRHSPSKAIASSAAAIAAAHADGPGGGGATTTSSGAAGSSSSARVVTCTHHHQRLAPAIHAKIMIALISTLLPVTALAARRQSPSSLDPTATSVGSTNVGSRPRRRNQGILEDILFGGGSGGMEGVDGINMILDGLDQNNIDVDVDIVGIIDRCIAAGNGNLDMSCFVDELDGQIPQFDVKEMADRMGIETEPYVPPPALDCPSGETEVKSFQIPATGEYCAVCIPRLATTICGYSCSCSNGDCGCSLKPPDCPGTLICAGTTEDLDQQEPTPEQPTIGDDEAGGAANDGGGADDPLLNEIPDEDAVDFEGGGTADGNSTAFFEEEDSAETGKDLAIQQEPNGNVDYNMSASGGVDHAVSSEDTANETMEATASLDHAETVPSSQLPRNDENSSSARKRASLGLFSLFVSGLLHLAASATVVL